MSKNHNSAAPYGLARARRRLRRRGSQLKAALFWQRKNDMLSFILSRWRHFKRLKSKASAARLRGPAPFFLRLLALSLCAAAGLSLLSCRPLLPQPAGGLQTPYPRADTEKEREDRREVRRRADKRYKSSKDCETDEDCEDICKDLFRRRTVEEDCLELPIPQVEAFELIAEILEKPSDDDLLDIDSEDLADLFRLSDRPIKSAIDDLSSIEAKRVLYWIASDRDIAEVFKDEDENYEMLKDLLADVDSSDEQDALSTTLDEGHSFMEKALEETNTEALDYTHSYFNEDCSSDVCIFQDWYCEFDLGNDDWESLLDYEDFQDIVREILTSYTTATDSEIPDWWDEAGEGTLDDEPDPDIELDDVEISSDTNELEDICDLDLEKQS